MKKIWSVLLIAAITITGCKKDDDCPTIGTTAPASEVATLKAYLDANGINATADSRGFFYTISAPGGADKPTACDYVQVSYTGKLTNGQTFDSSPGIQFSLSGVIAGWQEAVPLLGKGGSMVLYLPPSLGYGASANGAIPANSILIFTIGLQDFE